MNIQEMIDEWKTGCSNASSEHPEECHECTVALINSIEKKLELEEKLNNNLKENKNEK